jgi:glycosyltransferase involved in cell wall biosynthesis
MNTTPKVRLAYLVSRYPAISHTFILREVRSLRALGFEIETASINDADRSLDNLTAEEREEVASTYYVKQHGATGAAKAHFITLATRPFAYLRGLLFALKLGGLDLKGILFGVLYFIEAVMIGSWMKSKGLSHLHVHFATPASTVGLIATRIFPFTMSITVHGPDEFYNVSSYRLAEKIHGSKFICCIGSYARSQLMKLSPVEEWTKFEVSPLGVDPSAFKPRPVHANGDSFEVICVGRLVPAKGQHTLIEAIDRLVREGRNIRLTLVGDGPDRASLEQDADRRAMNGHIVFEGAVNQDRIRDLYARADAFALASFAEGIPVVLMEAMAMEIPCVTTFITGIPELIRDGVDGLLVAPSDDEELSRVIARLMDDAELRKRIGENGRKRVVDRYDLEQNTRRLAEIFRRRLGGSAA